MYNHLDSIPACDGRTDGQTDRRTFCDGIVRAMHTRRAVKIDPITVLFLKTPCYAAFGIVRLIKKTLKGDITFNERG